MKNILAVEEALLGELIAFRLELLGHHVDIRDSAERLRLALKIPITRWPSSILHCLTATFVKR